MKKNIGRVTGAFEITRASVFQSRKMNLSSTQCCASGTCDNISNDLDSRPTNRKSSPKNE
jgi:hypothetical protein